jgi:CO/xanthine dehydrogenase Mo-binding subunit
VPRTDRGRVAQGIGSALYEEVMVEDGKVTTPVFRLYRVPQFGDVPRPRSTSPTPPTTSALRREVDERVAVQPVAPAIGNAIARALGARPYEQPFRRDRVWRLASHHRNTNGQTPEM